LPGANFAGTALDKLTATIGEPHKAGLHQRSTKIKVVRSEDATVHYVALLTEAENSWKVRVLLSRASFLTFRNLSPLAASNHFQYL